ncbi:GTP-binding protein gtr2 [Linderina macrospora]|uniref:GTP-binding protein gtr2 n=1 Tax=Linderina macrospora TaxID=4868 RepID=A0ACC1J2A1_9FUNG|nr:GTP-binding protein gtr2 [Linderina macrospora]
MGENTSLVYVIDAQNEAGKSLTELMALIRVALAANPQLPVHVFIHKIDGLSEELKMETQQGIQQRVLKNMGFENLDSSNVQFFLTTIFSEAIREALSRVSLRMVPRCDHLESILNSFCSKSSLDKVFLLDVRSKIYLATDSSPTDPQLYQFACKTIDTIGDISLLCAGLGPEREDEVVMQRTVVTMDTNMRLFMYQVNLDLSLLCLGPSAVVKQQSLLEFNAAKVAKAIRQILQ